jgi:hypothetical protein
MNKKFLIVRYKFKGLSYKDAKRFEKVGIKKSAQK